MNCPNCKNPNQDHFSTCEWCNFIITSNSNIQDEKKKNPMAKGEGLFFSKRIKRTKCFYEIYPDGLRVFDAEEKLNLYIKKEVIFNIEAYNRFFWMHFLPILGSVLRFIILRFSRFRKGFCFVTSKSGKNILLVKKVNYERFNLVVRSYL